MKVFDSSMEKKAKKRSYERKGLLFIALLLYINMAKSGWRKYIRTPLIFHHMKNNS